MNRSKVTPHVVLNRMIHAKLDHSDGHDLVYIEAVKDIMGNEFANEVMELYRQWEHKRYEEMYDERP